jgi:DNA repair exonuclease SbcCD ATPase subunit
MSTPKKSLSEQLADAQASITQLTGERDEARTDSANHSQALAAAQAEAQSAKDLLAAEKSAHASDIESLQAAAIQIDALKASQADFDKAVAAKAQEQLAGIGVPAVAAELPKQSEDKPISALIAEMNQISDEKARADFYDKYIAPKLKR